MPDWERLPDDTNEICNYSIVAPPEEGESTAEAIRREFGNPCGEKAVWIKRECCDCGQEDMSLKHCQKHQDVEIAHKG